MNEQPSISSTFHRETPIPDPTLFLLNETNRDVVEGYSTTPVLQETLSNQTVVAILLIGGFGMIVTRALVVAMDLPAQLSGWAQLILIIAVFITMGVAFRMLAHDTDTGNGNGFVLMGEVISSQTIRVRQGRFTTDLIGVRYRFAAPGGVVLEGYVEGDSEMASDTMAPPAGTSVRVWYEPDGQHYLL